MENRGITLNVIKKVNEEISMSVPFMARIKNKIYGAFYDQISSTYFLEIFSNYDEWKSFSVSTNLKNEDLNRLINGETSFFDKEIQAHEIELIDVIEYDIIKQDFAKKISKSLWT